MELIQNQKIAIRKMRSVAYGTTNIHGLIGYCSVYVDGRTMKSLVEKKIAEYKGCTIPHAKECLYSLTKLGETIKL